MTRAGPNAALALAALGVLAPVLAAGPTAAATPPLSCADGTGGVPYAAPSNLTVADASNATADSPFAGNESIAVGDVTVSAGGAAFVRVERATGETCLSAVDATNASVTVDTDDATVTVDGDLDAFAFDDPAADAVAFAYRAKDDSTVTLADAGHPAGTTLRAVDAGTDAELARATVAGDGSLSLSLPPSEAGTRVRLATPPETASTDEQTPTERATASSTASVRGYGGAPESGTDGGGDDGTGVLWPLLLVVALLVIGAITARARLD